MTDREKKIAEIRNDSNDITSMTAKSVWIERARFLLSELEQMREERDSWERVARKVEEEKQSAQQEIERLRKLVTK